MLPDDLEKLFDINKNDKFDALDYAVFEEVEKEAKNKNEINSEGYLVYFVIGIPIALLFVLYSLFTSN